MRVDEVRTLKEGDLVRALTPVSGGICLAEGGEIEVELPAGAIATVGYVEHIGGSQGWGVTINFDNGITNVFDEGDDNGEFALERVEDTPELRRQRAVFLFVHSPQDYPPDELVRDVQRIMTDA